VGEAIVPAGTRASGHWNGTGASGRCPRAWRCGTRVRYYIAATANSGKTSAKPLAGDWDGDVVSPSIYLLTLEATNTKVARKVMVVR
jgi:hypothetical protein